MSSSPARCTDAKYATIRSLYAKHRNVIRVAEEFGCSQEVVRRAIDPKFAERRRATQRASYRKTSTVIGERHRVHRSPTEEPCEPAFDPRRDGYPEYPSPYAEMLGDPPVGRRQLLAERAPLEPFNLSDEEDNADVGC